MFHKVLSPLVIVFIATACTSPKAVGISQPLTADQAATLAAATMQALSTNTPEPTLEEPTELLPHALYYMDGSQVRRMERDGKTNGEMTLEPNGVDGYDVSLVDGSLAFIAENKLVLVNADGSNRRVLVQGDPTRNENDPRFFKDPLSNPVFSPDGQTIAYAHRGLNLYDLSAGISKRVLEDRRTEMGLAIEIYSPVRYSPDGTKLLVAMRRWEAPAAHAVYDPATNALVRIEQVEDDLSCCSEHGGPAWSPDGSSFYGVAVHLLVCCRHGELWQVDASTGAVTRSFTTFLEGDEPVYLPAELYPAPDGQLYFFFGTYHRDAGFFDTRVLNIVRAAPDGVTDRTVLRDENFIMMNEALWAPDASFVLVSTAPARNWDRDGGVLELYYTDAQKSPVWLAPFGSQMKWGP